MFRVLDRSLGVLDRAGVECAVMGGYAVRHWSLPRPTYDVDFVVAVDAETLTRLLRAFDEDGFTVDEHFLRGFVDILDGLRKVAVGCFDSGSVWQIDIFPATTPFVRSAFDRRVPAAVDGRKTSFVSPEDFLLFKLLADRSKDRLDIEELLFICGPLDLEYLRRWAEHLGIPERLDRTLRESGRA
ncbi:MAG TPA: hypothetical protein VMS76_11865 [Planctomycetota bacterium]|nr:hypothetical protein [Planctomycetota bacterium]